MPQEHHAWVRRMSVRAIGLSIAFFGAACTTVTVTPETVQKSSQTYRVVVLDKDATTDPKLAYLDTYFREGFLRRLKELKSFEVVSDTIPGTTARNTLFVDGKVTEADKGDALLRGFVGFGAGREHVTALLELKGSDGKSLGQLEIRKAYSGGIGMGGFANIIDLESLTTQVGEQAAQTLTDWSQGKAVATAN